MHHTAWMAWKNFLTQTSTEIFSIDSKDKTGWLIIQKQ